MKTLRLLSKDIFYKSLIILVVFFSSVIAEDEPIDIWKIENKDTSIEVNNEIKDNIKNQTNIIITNSSNQDTQIIPNMPKSTSSIETYGTLSGKNTREVNQSRRYDPSLLNAFNSNPYSKPLSSVA